MAAFASLDAADRRASAKMADNTWLEAFSCRLSSGSIAVRVLRPMSPGAGLANGGWVDITDDATT